MSTCELKLYNNMILPSRNMKIDNIESYLGGEDKTGSYLKYSSPNFQYQRIALNMQIKVNMNQSQTTSPSINYASIFQGGRFFYFFIMKAEQVARKTLRLYLSMDTINTFWSFLKWSDQTRITREHVDRFVGDKVSGVAGNYYRRNIDMYQEGMNPAKDAFTKNALVPDEVIAGTSNPCYLVWLANSEITPDKQSATPIIPTFCYDRSITVKDEQSYPDTSKKIEDFVERNEVVYVTSSNMGDSLSINFERTSPAQSVVEKRMLDVDSSTGSILRVFRIRYAGTSITIDFLYYTGDVYPYSYAKTVTLTLSADITSIYSLVGDFSYATYADDTEYYKNLQSLDVMDQLSNRREVNIGTVPAQRSVSFANLDRSSTRIVKIIKLPAPPLDVNLYSSLTLVPGYNLIRTSPDHMECYIDGADHHKLGSALTLAKFHQLGNTIDPKAEFNWENESKLYSSEFYDLSLQFHDYNYSMQLEQMNNSITPDVLNMMRVQFTVSAALTGDCRLEINSFNSIFTPKYNNQQYMFFSCYEVPQYNSSWINYLRNGYNYDAEQRKLSNRNAVVSGVLSLVGALPAAGRIGSSIASARSQAKAAGSAAYSRSFAASGAYDPDEVVYVADDDEPVVFTAYDAAYNPEDPSIPSIGTVRANYRNAISAARAAGKRAETREFVKNFSPLGGVGGIVIQQGIQAVSSAVSTFSSIDSNNRSYANTIRSQQAGTPAALSTVPYDLQPDDKVWIVESFPRSEIRNQIAKTFHYMGYSHPVTEIPDFTSRYWFNFVQCSPVFLGNLDVIHPEYEDDIKKRFEAGVTVMHQHDGEYDMDQKYENWESKFFPASSGSDLGGRL